MRHSLVPFRFSRLHIRLKDRGLLFLFALLSIPLQGYIYGYHDHTTQIPYIHWWNNPDLYPHDILAQTFPYYIAKFWDFLALASNYIPLYPLMLVSHILFRWLLFESIFHLGMVLTNNKSSGLLASSFFIMPLHYLGDFFPSPSFVHSCVAVPGLIYVLTEFIKGKNLVPLLLLGFLFNIHAMHAAFVAAIFFFILVRHPGRLQVIWIYLGGLLGIILSGPTLLAIWRSVSVPETEEWFRVVRIRASHHIFPFTWTWQWVSALIYFTGGFMCWKHVRLIHSSALKMSFLAVFLICLAGTFGSEFYPTPFLMKTHAFRSALYVVVILAVIWAEFLIEQIDLDRLNERLKENFVSLFIVCVTVSSLIISSYVPLLGAGILLFFRRSRPARFLSGIVFFILPLSAVLLRSGYSLPLQEYLHDEFLKTVLAFALSFPLLGMLCRRHLVSLGPRLKNRSHILSLFLIGVLSLGTIMYKERVRQNSYQRVLRPSWVDVQHWARLHTSIADQFITPPKVEGFKVYSQRGVVGAWQDGTASFWYPPLASEWLKRMVDLKHIDPSNGRVTDEYTALTKEDLLALSAEYGARFAVIFKPSRIDLPCVYENDRFVVFQLR